MREMLERLLAGADLDETDARQLLVALIDEATHPAMKGALLAALRAKGETADELRGLALQMREMARPVEIPRDAPLVDTCGTGGDASNSINLSTAASLVVAALGVRVVKHGNRSVSSRAGSADVLEALGISLPTDPDAAVALFLRCHWTFLFAPHFHPATKAVVPIRQALKVRTAFNSLGPLTNPAKPTHQLVGAFSRDAAEKMAHALAGMGVRAYVVHGAPSWDEATPCGPFDCFDVRDGAVGRRVVDPEDLGIPRCEPSDLAGGDAAHNAEALRAVFAGKAGPHRDAVVLNTALVLELLGEPIESALARARKALDDGTVSAYVAGLG